ncbi:MULTISPECIES: Hint domain-containing protein [unclassified Roseovarius]|uniref:Hint domain-containing protein n=1 Tax=unclassified Roseovarius TaxID=2614913 RepID=UPI00273D3AE5|nr:Hint domain-containing protein [Roseovarius sp. MMSF_3350]
MFGWKSTPGTRESFENADATAVKSGLISGTKVATGMGWRPVEAIAEGDRVLTFDGGLQTVTKVSRIRLWSGQDHCPRQFWPLEVPAGALGNREVMRVLPGQNIMVESDAAEDLYGDPFTLIPAEAIEGLYGVARTPPDDDVEVLVLHFAADQVVFGEDGALFFCPGFADMIDAAFTEEPRPFYSVLSMDEARFLAVQIEDEIAAVCGNSPQDIWAAAVPA